MDNHTDGNRPVGPSAHALEGSDAEFPGWIPCRACDKPLSCHIDKKCPFDSTNFKPDDAMLTLVLGELECIFQERRAVWPENELEHLTYASMEQLYNFAYERVVETLIGRAKEL